MAGGGGRPPGAAAVRQRPRAAYRNGSYPDANDQVRRWWFESGFPGTRNGDSSYKRATRRAAQTWNNMGRRFAFVGHGAQEVPYNAPYEQVRGRGEGRARYCGATRGADRVPLALVFWEPLPAPRPGYVTLGEATTCLRAEDGRPFKFFATLNRSLGGRWYRGESATCPGAPARPVRSRTSRA